MGSADRFGGKGRISVTSLATNADETVFRLNDAIVRIDNMVADNEKYLSEAFKNFQSSMKNADIFLSRGTDLIRDADTKVSIVQRRLVATLQGIEKVTENLNQLIDRLTAQPSELLFGQPLLHETWNRKKRILRKLRPEESPSDSNITPEKAS